MQMLLFSSSQWMNDGEDDPLITGIAPWIGECPHSSQQIPTATRQTTTTLSLLLFVNSSYPMLPHPDWYISGMLSVCCMVNATSKAGLIASIDVFTRS
jgi:hypothetical protein